MQASSTVTVAVAPLCGCLSKPQHSGISRARLCAASEGPPGQRMRILGIPEALSNRRGVYAAGLAAGVLLLSRAMLPLGRPRASSNSSLVELLRGESEAAQRSVLQRFACCHIHTWHVVIGA